MRKMAIRRESEVDSQSDYPVPVQVDGLRTAKLLSPPEYVLWLCTAELDAGATMTWPSEHSDQALYVFSGEARVGDQVCPEGGAVIVESDVPATVTFTRPTRIGHWGSWDRDVPIDQQHGAVEPHRHRVHVVGPRGIHAFGDPSGVAARFFADSSCSTCRISLFEVTRTTRRAGRPHSHSADEIIFCTDGLIELGAVKITPGTALCIPRDVRYAEGSGDDGAVFINYRRESSNRIDFVKDQPPVTSWETSGPGGDATHERDAVDVFAGEVLATGTRTR